MKMAELPRVLAVLIGRGAAARSKGRAHVDGVALVDTLLIWIVVVRRTQKRAYIHRGIDATAGTECRPGRGAIILEQRET